MSLPATADLEAYRGDTFLQAFRLLEDGDPVDLDGATVSSWASSGTNGTVEFVTEVTGAGELTIGAEAGSLEALSYRYDVEVTMPDGTVKTWVRGRLKVLADVTNAE